MQHKIAQKLACFGILASLAVTSFAFASLAMTSFAYGDEKNSLPAMLNSHVELVDETILLSDIFSNVERYGDSVISKSPSPGEEMLLPATWLWRIAKLYHVDWKPTSRLDTSLVTRSSSVISPEMINQAIHTALFERTGEDDLVEVEFKRITQELHISPIHEPSVKVSHLSYDKNSNRFSATLVAPAQGPEETSITITGNLHRLVEAAVPRKRIMPGEIIGSNDLNWKRFRARNVSNKAVLDASQIIGKSASRTLVVGKIISLNSVQPPILVKKKSLVTVSLNVVNMQITTQGKALQNGAMNEIIQIRNLKSNIMIEALVTGPGQAAVIKPAELAMN